MNEPAERPRRYLDARIGFEERLETALAASFCDAAVEAESDLCAEFLTNDPQRGLKVLSTIEEELVRCERFAMSVAFVTMSGVTPLLQTLRELEAKGIPGRILTTDYLCFSEPKAIARLAQFRNLEVRVFRTSGTGEGFHTKGYLFEADSACRLIVGSSNLTSTALTTNREWNAKLVAKTTGAFAARMLEEFEALWNAPQSMRADEVLAAYAPEYEAAKEVRSRIVEPPKTEGCLPALHPNRMQSAFVANVLELVRSGERRGLLISATGTGKTYASAFAVRALLDEPLRLEVSRGRRVLFLVHREQIARQAMESYRRVLGNAWTFGLYTGTEKSGAQILFATVQTMARHFARFDPQAFDLIVIDEVHRAGAASYRTLLEHFRPRFCLGMTASPDRPDGEDIYGLFDHNIPYELRLQGALEEDLLCPFHYFGITDIDSEEGEGELSDFVRLSDPERVRHIVREADYYGWSGERRKALIFVSTNDEARALSDGLNRAGWRTLALSGANSQGEREAAIARLTADATDDRAQLLDAIVTVDIFNEGVDIPEANQILLLRPTESPIVFIQQLGRGLRKHRGKEYVVVLDFIGAHANNWMIPVALSGDRTGTKDPMRRLVATSSRLIPGASTIHFDAIAKSRIYASIDAAKTNTPKMLREAYRTLRFKLGRIPTLLDFDLHGSIDPVKIFAHKSFGSYHAFLRAKGVEEAYKQRMDAVAEELLAYVSRRFGKGERLGEIALFELILKDFALGCRPSGLRERLAKRLELEEGLPVTEEHLESIRRLLTNAFVRRQEDRRLTPHCVFLTPEDETVAPVFESVEDEEKHWLGAEWRVSDAFWATLAANQALVEALSELCRFARTRWETRYRGGYRGTRLKLGESYTYEDVCRLLDWEKNLAAQNIGGYFYERTTKTLPVFINYSKAEDAIAYEDRFTSPRHLIALSKTKRRPESPDADHIYKRTPDDRENRIFLFVRKNKDDAEAKAFYFLGELEAEGHPKPVALEGGVAAFEIGYRLETPVRSDLYAYLTD